jgi:hypothetical protein
MCEGVCVRMLYTYVHSSVCIYDELTGHHIVPQPILCSSLQRHFAASP